jgi:hypothetical protein
MSTYTQSQIENVWFALNLNRLKPNNDMQSGAGLHNPNGSINMYKWLQDALDLLGNSSCGTSIGAVTLNGDAPLFTSSTCGATMNFTAGDGITLTGDGPTKSITISASGGGSGDNIYNIDGTLTGNRTVSLADKSLTFAGSTTPLNTTEWNGPSFSQLIGKTGSYVDGDTTTQILNFKILTNSSLDLFSTYYKSSSNIQTRVRIGATAGLENSFFEAITTNSVDSLTGVGISFGASVGGNNYGLLFLPTLYELGAGSASQNYMVPSVINNVTSEVQYTYPLQRFTFSFGTDINAATSLNRYSTQGLQLDSDGNKRTIAKVSIGAYSGTGLSGLVNIIIYAKDNTIVYNPGDIDLTGFTGGSLYEEYLVYPNNALADNDYFYAVVRTLSGSGTDLKGLQCIIETT